MPSFSIGTSYRCIPIEMWNPDTFDPEIIDKELAWAAEIGFNSVRVFLHYIPWSEDTTGYLDRIDHFLQIADRHGISTMLVLFDGVWDPNPRPGPQPAPRPHIHNSTWVQCPGRELLGDITQYPQLEGYVKGIMKRFANDHRVLIWDLFNEADNPNTFTYRKTELPKKAHFVLLLTQKTFAWAREVNPSQPLTAGIWRGNWSSLETMSELDQFMVTHSDVISFHSYASLKKTQKRVDQLKVYGRPVVCTEYLARGTGNTFKKILPMFNRENVGAYNWGLVNGKTQTIYPWSSWKIHRKKPPKKWHHDMLNPNGKPFDESEIELIRELSGRSR